MFLPKYMTVSLKESIEEEKLKESEGIGKKDDTAESIEPIIESYNNTCMDNVNLFFFPYFVYLLMQYRQQIYLPILFSIRTSDMVIYLYYTISLIVFQPLGDILIYGQLELFNGWKIYEYLVYSRYRFLQRETRWKGLEDSLDECIEENWRRLDQMCFSSQYYFMLTIQFGGIVYLFLAFECWLRANIYSVFSDSGFPILFILMLMLYIFFEWLTLFLARYFKVWKTKHEDTEWHFQKTPIEDELNIPGWEEIQAANPDLYLMNKRINSETFRYKFLNYNRQWLVDQLPNILTPRTLRRSRPYLMNQLAKILTTNRGDISDDSDDDDMMRQKRFGPVALSAASRGIVRYWLGKAKRRLKLRTIVDPVIRRARGLECEQCLSKNQLQVEYEIDIDKMIELYDDTYPEDMGEKEPNQLKWRNFWTERQVYHTLCLSCIGKRKEDAIRKAYQGGVTSRGSDTDSENEHETINRGAANRNQPGTDFGPIFLSQASHRIITTWLKKARNQMKDRRNLRRSARKQKPFSPFQITDDEADDIKPTWERKPGETQFGEPVVLSAASKAVAIKWMRTARARLQKKGYRRTTLTGISFSGPSL
jgi:hypothetical protein